MIGVTFRINYDNEDSYGLRYKKLHDVFKRYNIIEDLTTSCVFLDTGAKTDEVQTALYGALDYKQDMAIVFETYRHTFRNFGLR